MHSKHKTWAAYQKGFELANLIYKTTHHFPKEERYSLTDQIRRSSRSVCANLAEGAAKRRYPKYFIEKVTDSASENYETQTWLDFANVCNYIDEYSYEQLLSLSVEVGKLLSYMEKNPNNYLKQ